MKRQDQWQAQVQAQVQQIADIYLRTDNLSDEQIKDALLLPCNSIEETIEQIMDRSKTNLKICVLPEGPQTVAYVR